MHVEHFAVEFACAYAIADAETQFRTNGNGFERIDIATMRAQFGSLRPNARSVVKDNFCFREKREARMGTPHRVGSFSHGVSPVRKFA